MEEFKFGKLVTRSTLVMVGLSVVLGVLKLFALINCSWLLVFLPIIMLLSFHSAYIAAVYDIVTESPIVETMKAMWKIKQIQNKELKDTVEEMMSNTESTESESKEEKKEEPAEKVETENTEENIQKEPVKTKKSKSRSHKKVVKDEATSTTENAESTSGN
jgi:outer membrane biosynthesis protein TonB